ncbi:hypothetical protein RyT2_07480 [Pseudolactococcus yaeyamensis]
MSKYEISDAKVATVLGIIFVPSLVVWAYHQNKYTLDGQAMTGGRYYWRNFGWSFLTGLLFVGLIYGLVKLNDIVETRNELTRKLAKLNHLSD